MSLPGEYWRRDRRALSWRIGLLLYATMLSAIELPRQITAGHEVLFVVGVCVLGVLLIGVVLAVRLRFGLRPVKKCLHCFAKNAGEAPICRKCGSDFEKVSTESISPPFWEVPYGVRRNHVAVACFLVGLAVTSAVAWFLPRETMRFANMFMWAFLFIAYDLAFGLLFRRVQRELVEHDGRLCIRCAYPIDDAMKRCPECGRGCSVSESKEMWTRAGMWFPQNEPRA